MKYWSLMGALLLLSVGAWAQGPGRLTLGVGNSREIRLGSNPEMGHQWTYALSDSSIVKITSKYQANKPPRPGAGGEQIYTVKGLRQGTTLWILNYVPSDPKQKPARTVHYLITVH
ncbi:protease inhibitor I42 family protein [Siphonobacter curvatus]|uniref:Proteinase inhibitor I42 chagasin domain-containing protein n=1 Tax=Siphonobacter curvatus TaxID=2094562 RepID=A0A2S7IFH0_9BACT|nr:protease inhibitor I42 family protein [Siphonobacter curvatus]PQA53746.1 hypothetical protein C5O19_24025 [Siphonobacter curvatus]